MKTCVGIRVILTIIVGMLVAGAPLRAAAIQPHEDPETAPFEYDGVSLLHEYSIDLDYVLPRDNEGMEAVQKESALANIPPDLRESVDTFLSLVPSLADLLPDIRSNLEDSSALLAVSRPEESAEGLARASEGILHGYATIRYMETAASDAAAWWRLDTTGEHSPLRLTYNEVMEKLKRFREMLGLLQYKIDNLNILAQTLKAIDKRVAGADLADALKDLTRGGNPGDELTKRIDDLSKGVLSNPDASWKDLPPDLRDKIIDILQQKGKLVSTSLTLSADPALAYVGESIQLRGSLTAEGQPLGQRLVTIVVDGLFYSVQPTGDDGSFESNLTLPYLYSDNLIVQAVYAPAGTDFGAYLGCASPEVTIKALWYPANVVLTAPSSGYPGVAIEASGKIAYIDRNLIVDRPVSVFLDNDPIASFAASDAFKTTVHIPEDAAPGIHTLSVTLPPQGRYAPSLASAKVKVSKAVVTIDLASPPVLLLPLSLGVSGKARSALGPLKDADVRVKLGDWQTSVQTDSEGRFNASLGTGLSFALFGAQQLTVSAAPKEPWNSAGSAASSTLVINPINLALIFLAVAILLAIGFRNIKARLAYRPVLQQEPSPVSMTTDVSTATPAQKVCGSPAEILRAVYQEILRLVYAVTSIAQGPNRTLREYAQECSPKLGPLGKYFRDLTLAVERMLYSAHAVSAGDAVRSEEISQKLREELKREDA